MYEDKANSEFASLLRYWNPDLGAFEKLRKAIISFASISVRPSVRTEKLGSQWKDFNEKLYLNIFRKSVDKFQISLQCGSIKGFCT